MSVIFSSLNNSLEATPEYRQPLIIPSPPIPTMQIASEETESGFVIINASDFDAATMTPYVVPAEKPAKAKAGK